MGVESGYTYCGLSRDRGYLTCKYPRKQLYEDCSFALCDKCEYKRISSPPFTAEKQLELIKYILTATTTDELRIYYSEILKCYVFHWYSIPELDMRDSCTTQNAEYELALAELVTMLKNELNHAKVKEILE